MQVVLQRVLSLLGLVGILSGCGSEADSTVSRVRTLGGSNDQSSKIDLNSTGDLAVATEAMYLGKGVTVTLDLPNGYGSKCDSSTSISWKLIGDPLKVSLDKSDTCRPILKTTDSFQGDASLEVAALIENQNLKFKSDLKLKSGLKLDPKFVAPGMVAWSSYAYDSASFETSLSDRAKQQTWLYQNRDRFYGVYVETRFNGPYLGLVFFRHDRAMNKGFRLPIPLVADDSETNQWSLEGACIPLKGTMAEKMTTECPFEFESMNFSSPILKFRFKTETPNVAGIDKTWVYLKNVYRFGSAGDQDYRIVLKAKHPHMKDEQIIEAGIFRLYLTWD